MLTQEQAKLLCDAHEIYSLLDNDEETELLEANNPELLEAYYALHRVAAGADTATEVDADALGVLQRHAGLKE